MSVARSAAVRPACRLPGGWWFAASLLLAVVFFARSAQSAGPTLSVADVTLREGTGGETVARLVLTASAPSSEPLGIEFQTLDGSARAGLDYLPRQGTLILPPGTTQTTLQVAVLPDELAETAETFELRFTPNPAFELSRNHAVVTIIDDDIPSIQAADVTVLEENETGRLIRIPFTLSIPSSIPVSVRASTLGDTALPGADFVTTNAVITFAPGSQREEFLVPLETDGIAEFSETFLVMLTDPVNATIAKPSSRISILDDDPIPAITVTGGSVSESGAEGTTLPFHIRLSGPSLQPVRVSYSTRNGTASAGIDYLARIGTLIIPAGDTEATLEVNILRDAVAEPDEVFTLVLRNPVNATIATAIATGLIQDDDRPLAISVADTSALEGSANAPGRLIFDVLLSATPTNTVMVNYTTFPLSAIPGSDFLTTTGVLTFVTIGPEAGRHRVEVPVLGDAVAEPNESVGLRLSNPIHAVLDRAEAVGEILNDDGVVLVIDDASAPEGDVPPSRLPFTIRRLGPALDAVTVQYTTAQDTAKANTDFIPRSGLITFLPGETRATISVDLVADTVEELDEVFAVELSNPVGATILRSRATGTISNDDLPSIRVEPVTVTESDTEPTYAQFVFRLNAAATREVRVDYNIESRTAIAGEDFLGFRGTMTFPAGIEDRLLSVPVLGDLLNENSETFAVTLSNPRFAQIATTEALATIVDNDPIPSLLVADSEIVECSGLGTRGVLSFPLRLSAPSGREVSVPFQTRDVSATSGTDYTGTAGIAIFPPGETSQSISIPIACDDDDERDELFEVILGSPAGAVVQRARARGRIIDDDPPILTIDDTTVPEGNSGTTEAVFRVSLSSPAPETVQVDVITLDGSAEAGSDYLSVSNRLLILPGVTTEFIRVPILPDTRPEADETFRIELRHPENAQLARSQAQATVMDDDPPLVSTPVLAIEDQSFEEGPPGFHDIRIRIQLSQESSLPVRVLARTAPDSARADSDFLPTESVVVLPPGSNNATFSVVLVGDAVAESPESFLVELSDPDQASIGRSSARITIADDDPVLVQARDLRLIVPRSEPRLAEVQVSLSQPAPGPLWVEFSTSQGTALPGSDFDPVSGSLQFLAGETNRIITLPIAANDRTESDEFFWLDLGPVLNGVLVTQRVRIDLIQEAIANAPPQVRIASPTASQSATTGSPVRLLAAATDPDGSVVSVQFRADDTALGEVLQPPFGMDWTPSAPGVYALTARATDDGGLSTLSEAVTVTVLPPARLNASDVSQMESGGSARVQFSLSRPLLEPIHLTFATRDLTATAAQDFTPVSGTLTFQPGEILQTLEIAVTDDALDETDETLAIDLASPDNVTLAVPEVLVHILDDDALASTNQPPRIQWLRPDTLSVFAPGSPVDLEARATDPEGSLERVEFLMDGQRLGDQRNPPFTWRLSAPTSGDHFLVARAVDASGASTDSSPLRISIGESCGNVALVFNVANPEIETLRQYLFELGHPVSLFRSIEATAERLASFQLVIWHDGGARGLGSREVQLFADLANAGLPLYFIGDQLIESIADLDTEAQAAWIRLTQLRPGPLGAPSERVEIQYDSLPDDLQPILNQGVAGDVVGFDYPFPGPTGTRSEPEGEIILARAGDRDVLVALRESTGHHEARRLAQSFLVATRGDAASVTPRKRLFQNAVSWLLGCPRCANLNLVPTLTVAPAPAPESDLLLITARIQTIGTCDALAVRATLQVPDGVQFIRAETSRGAAESSPSEPSVRFDLGRLAPGPETILRILARPTRPGPYTVLGSVECLNESGHALDDNRLVSTSGAFPAPKLAISRAGAGPVELRITGTPLSSHTLEFAPTPTGPWVVAEIALPTTEQPVVTIQIPAATASRFYRVRTP